MKANRKISLWKMNGRVCHSLACGPRHPINWAQILLGKVSLAHNRLRRQREKQQQQPSQVPKFNIFAQFLHPQWHNSSRHKHPLDSPWRTECPLSRLDLRPSLEYCFKNTSNAHHRLPERTRSSPLEPPDSTPLCAPCPSLASSTAALPSRIQNSRSNGPTLATFSPCS